MTEQSPSGSKPADDPIAQAIIEYWGERCPDYSEGCPCCSVWSRYDTLSTLETPPLAAQDGEWGPGYEAYDECATEGCGKPGTMRFEGGGVGSSYCAGCYTAIKGFTTPPSQALNARDGEALLRRAAGEAYRVCAETRHVTLGDKARDAILALTHPAAGRVSVSDIRITDAMIEAGAKALEKMYHGPDKDEPFSAMAYTCLTASLSSLGGGE